MHIAFITFKRMILLTEVRIQSVFARDGKNTCLVTKPVFQIWWLKTSSITSNHLRMCKVISRIDWMLTEEREKAGTADQNFKYGLRLKTVERRK
jgi:hypothetical protein